MIWIYFGLPTWWLTATSFWVSEPSSDLCGHHTCTYFTYIHVDKAPIHINEKKKREWLRLQKWKLTNAGMNVGKGEHVLTVGENMNVQIL